MMQVRFLAPALLHALGMAPPPKKKESGICHSFNRLLPYITLDLSYIGNNSGDVVYKHLFGHLENPTLFEVIIY